MNNMTNNEYKKYVDKKTPNSTIIKDVFFAFVIGGIICIIGQLISDGYTKTGLSKELSAIATSITLILLSCILTGFGIYDRIAKYAGAGTIVPITGFANSVVSPAMEFKSEGLVLGLAAKMFVIAGPVLVYGIGASVLAGLYYYIISIF
ncbi:MAG: stage V sporulation protein AC [Ruminococcaceae bacterium]|nr:stage V sporulation protein AC [Oscillospiraceae bacterium]